MSEALAEALRAITDHGLFHDREYLSDELNAKLDTARAVLAAYDAKREAALKELADLGQAYDAAPAPVMPFQTRVHDWVIACFGAEIGADKIERNHRFIEEALELVQSNGCTASEAHQLVDYVYGRPVGDPHQEVGGAMITLAALCTASGIDMTKAGEDELALVWAKVEAIRAKNAAKPKHSPLPALAAIPAAGAWEPPSVRTWSHYPIQMPVTADGRGPATIGVDAVSIEYEVWEAEPPHHAVASFDNLPDAINEAMRLSFAAIPPSGAWEPPADRYVIWSNQHKAWWRPKSAGYVRDVRGAGVYDRKEALSICFESRDGWGLGEPPHEVPVRVSDLPEWAQTAFAPLPPAPAGEGQG